jgi:hypothetical protein
VSLVEFETYIATLEYLLGVNYLHIPSSVIRKLGGTLNIRLLCTVNNKLTFQCGLVALGQGDAYITINLARMKKLKLKTGDTVTVKLEKDESEYGLPMSEELEAVLHQDEEGFRRFKALTPGMKRYVIQYVNTVKNPQLRIDRSLLLIQNLKLTTEGKETFRAMLGKGD